MHPILQAEEALQHITNIAVGTGSLKKEDSRKIMKLLQKEADQRKPKKIIPMNIRKAMLASMGMGVVDLRKKKVKSRRSPAPAGE